MDATADRARPRRGMPWAQIPLKSRRAIPLTLAEGRELATHVVERAALRRGRAWADAARDVKAVHAATASHARARQAGSVVPWCVVRGAPPVRMHGGKSRAVGRRAEGR